MDAQATTATATVVGGAIAVFAKCPIAGSSKTRLAPLLGPEGAAALAKAMLSDILVSLSGCPLLRDTLKVLVYAPGTTAGEAQMISILQSLHLSHCREIDINTTTMQQFEKIDGPAPGEITNNTNNTAVSKNPSNWVLLPMKSSSASKSDLTSSSLGDKLEDALERIRTLIDNKVNATPSHDNTCRYNNKSVLFLGMDSPELPMEEIVYGLQIASGDEKLQGNNENETVYKGKAHLCPANDGGYGLLSVPSHAPSSKIFSGVTWSHSLTAVSQLKALTDANANVSIGRLMYDVDEPSDVKDLAMRLIHGRRGDDERKESSADQESPSSHDSLTNLSSGIDTTIISAGEVKTCYPHSTWKALLDMNVIELCEDDGNDGRNSVARISKAFLDK